MTDDELIEAIARKIAGSFGPPFDEIPKDKRDWMRPEMASKFDCNQPQQCDLLDAAKDALAIATPEIERRLIEKMRECSMPVIDEARVALQDSDYELGRSIVIDCVLAFLDAFAKENDRETQ